MFVLCECCVLSGRGLCDELITSPEESYRLWCVVVCALENLKNEFMTPVESQRHMKIKIGHNNENGGKNAYFSENSKSPLLFLINGGSRIWMVCPSVTRDRTTDAPNMQWHNTGLL